jgi:hypothetical protein
LGSKDIKKEISQKPSKRPFTRERKNRAWVPEFEKGPVEIIFTKSPKQLERQGQDTRNVAPLNQTRLAPACTLHGRNFDTVWKTAKISVGDSLGLSTQFHIE